ncbi:WYL domain-containing protein [Brevibacterium samyangense]|uniref:WYL domain-containing protein n=1 Tax=Brevibacterium samyangense TaxID=366888 RepID=A0ABP5ETH4_9MICO
MQPGPTNDAPPGGGSVDVAALALALRDRTRLRVHYRASGTPEARPLCVDPYGLASRAGRWYLVCDVEARPRLLRVDRIIRVEPLPDPARLRTGESLRTVWAELSAAVEAPGAVRIEARLRADRLDLAQRILGTRLRAEGRGEGGPTAGAVAPGDAGTPGDATTPGDAAWIPITVHYRELEGVRQLLQFGDHIEVLGPPEARALIARLAADLTRRHAEPLD